MNHCLLAVLASCAQPANEGSLRARVWTELSAINDRSVRSIHTVERVTVEQPDGTDFDFFEYTLRQDELGNFLLIGWHQGRPSGTDIVTRTSDIVSMRDGVMTAINQEKSIGVVRPERPDLIVPRCTPSTITGLGRSLSPSELTTLHEYLIRCADLRVVGETDTSIMLEGCAVLSPLRDGRAFRLVVELAPNSDVHRVQIFDTRWSTLFVQWDMRRWESHGGVRLPTETQYQVFEWKITKEQRAELAARMTEAGLTRDAVSPFHPQYHDWLAVRDGVLGGPLEVRLTSPSQRSQSRVIGANLSPVDSSWTRLPPEYLQPRYLSAYLEAPVDGPQPEPSIGYVGPGGGSE